MAVCRFCLLYLLFLSNISICYAEQHHVVAVSDGDTITVLTPDKQQVKIRLYGIDCPEMKQAFGNRARQATKEFVGGKTVDIQPMDTDRYGRIVAVVSMPDGSTLNESLVSAGLAWVYPQYCKQKDICDSLRELEAAARTEKLGLWADKSPVEPWEWRKRKNTKDPLDDINQDMRLLDLLKS